MATLAARAMAERPSPPPAAPPRRRRPDDARGDVRAADAVRATGGLWLLVLAIFLPLMVARHRGWSRWGLAAEVSTFFLSMTLAALPWAAFRATVARALPLRIAALALAVIAAAAGQAGFDLLLAGWLAAHPALGWPTAAADLARGYPGLLNDATVFAANAGLFQLAFDRRRARRQERQLARLHLAGQRAELEALRFRLNPHFLFNTLNGISAMIVTRRLDEADEMVDRLSAFLRASLAGPPAAAVPLGRELGVVEHYLRIEQFRFGDRLAAEIDCAPDAAELPVPPLLLQQLVEQAVEAASRADVTTRVAVSARLAGGRLQVAVEHPHMTMPERHLATARARLAATDGQVLGEAGATRLVLLSADGEPRD